MKTLVREKAWKAYFITCGLLTRFEGIHSMIAEKELFQTVLSWAGGNTKRETLVEYIEFMFGLNDKKLKQAEKDFDKSEKQEDAIYGIV